MKNGEWRRGKKEGQQMASRSALALLVCSRKIDPKGECGMVHG
jgi:hypothetical protein